MTRGNFQGKSRRAGGCARPPRFAAAAALALVLALTGALFPAAALADTRTQGNAVNLQQLPDSSFIYDSSIADLAEADAYFDGQIVQVVGEAVGDNLRATADGQYRWITLVADDDSGAAVSVYMTEHAADLVDVFGRYGVTGTMLQVRGTFHLACDEHDGLSDLHADNVDVVRKGVVSEEPFDFQRFVPGIVFVVVGGLLTLVFYFLRERQR